MSFGTDFLRFNRGTLLGSWRWPVGAAVALVAALLSAFAESWVAAIVFGAVAVGLFAIGRAGGKRRRV